MGKVAFGIRVVGTEANCLFEVAESLYEVTTLTQCETKIVVRFRVVWSKVQCLFIVLNCFFVLALEHQCVSEQAIGIEVFPIGADSF